MSTSSPEVTAGPEPGLAWLQVGLALVGLVAAVGLDPLGRLLVLPVAGVVLALGARDLLLRPVLRATSAGLTVVHGLHRVTAGWPEVERLRVVTDRRVSLLEVDLGDLVVVLSRRRLGAPPSEVLERLEGWTVHEGS